MPFYSVDFCDPQCHEDYWGFKEAQRQQALIDHELEKRTREAEAIKARKELQAKIDAEEFAQAEADRALRKRISDERFNDAEVLFQAYVNRRQQEAAETCAEMVKLRQKEAQRREDRALELAQERKLAADKYMRDIEQYKKKVAEEYKQKEHVSCRQCKRRYPIYSGFYSAIYCSVECKNSWLYTKKLKDEAERNKAREAAQRAYEAKLKSCKLCNKTFEQSFQRQRYCSKECELKVPIKKSNDYWLSQEAEVREAKAKKRQKENRRKNELLNKAHVKNPEWTGKQYKAVRG